MGSAIMSLLLDSVILIDHFNGVKEAQQFILENYEQIALSVITRAEVLVGFDEKSQIFAKRLLDKFPTLPITIQDADLAAKLRHQHKWKLPDALQAALAKNHKLKLVTRNTKDFPPRKYKFVKVPYTL